MISVRNSAWAGVVAAAFALLAAGAATADTHAPWPADWNNWNDPALWVTVGNPGSVADTRYATPGYGAVAYTYNIGKFEVTAGQYTALLNAVAGVDTYGLYNTDMSNTSWGSGISQSGGGTVGNPYTYSVASDFANRPVSVSFWDACRFANWLHNGQPTGGQSASTTEDGAYTLTSEGMAQNTITRNAGALYAVTSEDEWYKAAYYNPATGTHFDYPTTSNTAPGQDMTDASGNNANYYAPPYTRPIDCGKYTTVAGEFQSSDSPYGTFDQGGNVWEWNEAIIHGAYRSLRGGSQNAYAYHLSAPCRGDTLYSPTHEGGIGFRMSQVPEPATLTLLAVGGLMALRRRR